MSSDELEIERSWVIGQIPPIHEVKSAVYHEIGYLLTTNPEDKEPGELRVWRKSTPEWEYGITVKNMGDVSRNEWEGKLFPEWAFNVLWDHTKSVRVYKTRFYSAVKHNGLDLVLEIDVYEGNLDGLIRVECEFPTVAAANNFFLPSMVGKAIEVTYDKRFKNSKLAKLSKEEYKELMSDLSL